MFKILDTKKAGDLFIVRKGWLSPQYTLTDNAFSYGDMAYSGLSRRNAIIKTDTAVWLLNWRGPFSRTTTIKDETGNEIGTAVQGWFSHRVILSLQTGFKAEFYKPSFWSREYAWMSDGCGKILQITTNPFSLTDTVNINSSMAPVAIIPLLIFLGEHLIILRRRRKAAH